MPDQPKPQPTAPWEAGRLVGIQYVAQTGPFKDQTLVVGAVSGPGKYRIYTEVGQEVGTITEEALRAHLKEWGAVEGKWVSVPPASRGIARSMGRKLAKVMNAINIVLREGALNNVGGLHRQSAAFILETWKIRLGAEGWRIRFNNLRQRYSVLPPEPPGQQRRRRKERQ